MCRGAWEETLEFALHHLGKVRRPTPAPAVQAAGIVGRGVSGDLGEARLLRLGSSESHPSPYSREWPVKRAVPRKSKPCDLG